MFKYRNLFVFIFLIIGKFSFSQNELDSLLVELEQTMDSRKVYDEKRENRILNLKELLNDETLGFDEVYQINKNIIEEYKAYSFDSTLFYIEKNIALANKLDNQFYIDKSQLKLTQLLNTSGRYSEAIDILKSIDRQNLSEELLFDYFMSYQKCFMELSIYSLSKENKQRYSDAYLAYRDSLYSRTKSGSDNNLELIENRLRDERELDESLKINTRRLAMTSIGTPTYSLAAFQRALTLELKGENDEHKKYLILSAISDIQAAIKDNASLTSLALKLFEEKDIERAHNYIQFSFEDAEFYNSRLRYIIISNIFPGITNAYEEQIEKQKEDLRLLLILSVSLGLILLFTVVFIVRQMKRLTKTKGELLKANMKLKALNEELNATNLKLEKVNADLSESSLVKEHYIGTFLNLFSNYIDKLDDYRKMVKKHIVAKKVSDLYEKTKSNQIIQEELKFFYKNFDDTFLHIYPDFVEQMNALLKEEGQIKLKKNEQLNTELRVFALIRLGIKDSSKIANLLKYSVNTIYNYRVKVKNNAKGSRETFEDDVMKIGISY